MSKTPEEKAARKARRKAKRKARRAWLGRVFNVIGPLARRVVLWAAKETQLDGDARAKAALRELQQRLDDAIVLPEPWETLSDLGIKGLGTLLEGALEKAYLDLVEEGLLGGD